jgi:predicted HicB family RNase H-like nuclease
MARNDTNNKCINLRLDKELWVWLKHQSAAQELSMNEIITQTILRYKKRFDNKLTSGGSLVESHHE